MRFLSYTAIFLLLISAVAQAKTKKHLYELKDGQKVLLTCWVVKTDDSGNPSNYKHITASQDSFIGGRTAHTARIKFTVENTTFIGEVQSDPLTDPKISSKISVLTGMLESKGPKGDVVASMFNGPTLENNSDFPSYILTGDNLLFACSLNQSIVIAPDGSIQEN